MKLSQGMLAVVTGAGSGMGAAVSESLSAQGVSVVILDNNLDAAKQQADKINGVAIGCDVSSNEQVEEAFSEISKLEGELRVAINCAGVAPASRVVGRNGPMNMEAFEKVIRINLLGTFNVLRLAANKMFSLTPIEDERGCVINTASVAAFEGQIGQSAYSASKGAIVSMTLPIAREFASQGVRVNTIAPGLIATPLLLNMPEEVQKSLAASVPFPPRLGYPNEFASLAMHIVSNQLINGEVIRLDGAIRMQPK
jgi:NAD(P)-dependent dehydrogenase (short-subunit alcohol dehydrogenase family)